MTNYHQAYCLLRTSGMEYFSIIYSITNVVNVLHLTLCVILHSRCQSRALLTYIYLVHSDLFLSQYVCLFAGLDSWRSKSQFYLICSIHLLFSRSSIWENSFIRKMFSKEDFWSCFLCERLILLPANVYIRGNTDLVII